MDEKNDTNELEEVNTDESEESPNELAKVNKQSRSLYEFAENLNVTDVVFRSNCLLCKSAHRKEAEELYSRTTSYTKVHRFLENKGEAISYPAVAQHIKKHFLTPIMNARIQDYAENLKEFSNIQQGQIERYHHHINMLDRRILMIEANTDEEDIDSQRKTGETVSKLMDQIHKLETNLTEIEQAKEPVKILLTKFDNIVRVKIEDVTSPEARMIVEEILEEFIRSAEELDY
jgi:hypothetical protein